MKTALKSYGDFLRDAGLSQKDADCVVRYRQSLAKNRVPKSGGIKVEKKNDEAEILLYSAIGFDFFGDGFTPKKLVDQLKDMGGVSKISLRVNSPGGDVFDAVTMFNILRRQEAEIHVDIDGLAASAASFLVQVADKGKLRISAGGTMMIHRAWGITIGNSKEMAEMSEVLAKLDGTIAGIYAERSGRKAATWLNLMDKETWFNGEESVSNKLADEVTPAKRVAASISLEALSMFKNTPEELLKRINAEEEVPEEEEEEEADEEEDEESEPAAETDDEISDEESEEEEEDEEDEEEEAPAEASAQLDSLERRLARLELWRVNQDSK